MALDTPTKMDTTMKIEKPVRRMVKSIARKDQTYSQVVKQRIKCDAAGCDAAGINEIKVSAGKFGIVTLFVCADCIGKFQEDNKAVSPYHKASQQEQFFAGADTTDKSDIANG